MFGKLSLASIALILFTSCLVWWQWPHESLEVITCNVGQGDATLIIEGFSQVVIDGGPSRLDLLDCLGQELPFWDRNIELIVLTHPDQDHLGGLLEVLKRYQVDWLVVSPVRNTTDMFDNFLDIASQKNMQVLLAKQGQTFEIGQMSWNVLWPQEALPQFETLRSNKLKQFFEENKAVLETTDLNESSVVLEMQFQGKHFLFSGDIGIEQEQALISQGVIAGVDVLKVPHHGSKTSSSDIFLDQLKPKLALIGVGKDNRFGHPASEVLERYTTRGIRVLRTDLHGKVKLTLDDSEKLYFSCQKSCGL